jgi:S-adenosylmethionine synthetase
VEAVVTTNKSPEAPSTSQAVLAVKPQHFDEIVTMLGEPVDGQYSHNNKEYINKAMFALDIDKTDDLDQDTLNVLNELNKQFLKEQINEVAGKIGAQPPTLMNIFVKASERDLYKGTYQNGSPAIGLNNEGKFTGWARLNLNLVNVAVDEHIDNS